MLDRYGRRKGFNSFSICLFTSVCIGTLKVLRAQMNSIHLHSEVSKINCPNKKDVEACRKNLGEGPAVDRHVECWH